MPNVTYFSQSRRFIKVAICQQFKFLCSTEIFARYRQLLPTVHLFRYSKFIIRDKKKRKNLPSSHFSPLHCGLHEQPKASFSLSNKQEPPLRHPAIRQPLQKITFYLGKQKLFSIDFLQLFTLANVLR